MPKAVQYTLVITEKPSVAKTYADLLGIKNKQDGFFEGRCTSDGRALGADRSEAKTGYLISWCIGHLVELVMPQDYDEKYRKWQTETLPIIPEKWKYQVSPSTRKQFNILEKLMNRKDVKEILCATDAGREGELIFRLVYQQTGCRKPFRRIWLSSMEDAAVKKAFAHPRPGADYDRLYEAARCREQADWIVGINATRLFSCLYRDMLNIGRVMTPTLAMVAERETAIKSFIPESYYVVRIMSEGIPFDSRKYKNRDEALLLAKACRSAGKAVIENIVVKEKREKPPLLFDLTALQREANKRFGFSAQQTLDYAQSLYEKKLLTYPRTDSRYLTSDMEKMIPQLIRKTVEPITGLSAESDLRIHTLLNDAKVTDHTALLPTANAGTADLDELPSGEQAILQMVMLRLLTATSVPYVCEETKVLASCGGETFAASGKRILDHGWKKYEPDTAKETILPSFSKNMPLRVDDIAIKDGKTTPPERFTEGTLLHAMETAGKEDMPEEAERSGIGTPATRAGIIEKLVRIGFLQRSGNKKAKTLTPTERGLFLISILLDDLKSVSMTADWEKKLLAIEKGVLNPDAFLQEIHAFTEQIVKNETVKPRRSLPAPKPEKKSAGTIRSKSGLKGKSTKSYSGRRRP